MKRMLRFAGAMTLVLCASAAFSQRYLTEQFSATTETLNVPYDSNMAVNLIPPNNPPIVKVGLHCDIYEPSGDSETKRPLIIIMHTGSFLPAIVNRQVTGNKNDSTVVEMCRRFARKGYVAVAMNYRLGWNPTVMNADTATAQLLQATYRAIQDAKNCVRFMRENYAAYGIDTSRIVVGGIGTGGYVALAYATLNKQKEVELEKFRYSTDPYPPMVNTAAFGNWDGIGGISQLNISGNAAIRTDVNAVFHIGGALGDSTWIEGNEVPILSMHCVLDPYAPYNYGNVIVPTTGVTVINQAAGGSAVQRMATNLGINDTFANRDYTDAITTRARSINGGREGLYPFILPARTPGFANEGSPWEWWDSTVVKSINFPYAGAGQDAHNNSMFNNPDMSKEKAMKYIDTMQAFLSPRLVCAMGLPGCPAKLNTSATPVQKSALSLFPNPSQGTVILRSKEAIQSIQVFDLSGKLVYTQAASAEQVELKLNLTPGAYMVLAQGSNFRSTAKLIIE